MGVFKPKTKKEVRQIIQNINAGDALRSCLKRKLNYGTQWLIENRRIELDDDWLRLEVGKAIRKNDVKLFKLFQKTGIVNENNYLEFVIRAGCYSKKIFGKLMKYPLQEPGLLYIRINQAINRANKKHRKKQAAYLKKYLKRNKDLFSAGS